MSKSAMFIVSVLLISCCTSQPSSEPHIKIVSSERETISLDGEWELLTVKEDLDIAQTKTRAWKQIQVPHHLLVWEGFHRAWYRCRFSGITAPKVVLAFDSVNFRCIIYVNNQFVGEHIGGYLPFEVDITEYIKETNELLVGVENVAAVLKKETYPDLLEGTPDNITHPVGSGFHIFGIWQSVSLKIYPFVYIEDVFVKCSYRKKEIELEITIADEGKTDRTLIIKNEVVNEFTFPESHTSVKAEETKKIILTKKWEYPVLWCPENPHLYVIRTSLEEKGEILDAITTRVGFREFWVEDGSFFLNGIPINVRGSSKHLLGDPWTGDHQKDAEETLTRVLAVNSNALRLHANPYPEVFLDLADEMGVLIIDESALWCLSDQYDLASDEFWINAQEHVKTLVKRDRNHPSLVIWSVENEILLCGGYHEERCTSELIHLGDIIKQLDPSRPIMYEGDFDLPNADIINLHYPHEYPEWTVFPNEAYFLNTPVIIDSYPQTEFLWDRKKPLYIGEFLWIPPLSPHPHTIFYGDEAFTDHELYRKKAKAEAWKMYIEAFRSQGVNGYCPWNVLEGGEYPTPLSETLKEVFSPFFGFIKEYTTHFFSGQHIKRTLIICNGTSENQEVAVAWSSGSQSGEHSLVLGPAERAELEIDFAAPHVEKRESFEFTVSISYDSQVLRIKKVYEAFPREKFTLRGNIALYDPVGETKKILDENGIGYTLVDTFFVPSDYDLLIIGYHALKETEVLTVGESLYNFQGNVLCFEQKTLTPLGLNLTDHCSSITFERTPLFDLKESDLRFWQHDNIVSKYDISKPGSGNYTPLIDSGGSGGLEYTCLLEHCCEKGKVIFCQMLLTEKYNTEPATHILFEEILTYALNTTWSQKKLGVIKDSEMLNSLGAEYEKAEDFNEFDVLFVNEPVNAKDLHSFVVDGGIAWLHGWEPEQVKALIDVEFERITYEDLPILLQDNELTRGLSNQEFYWTGERQRWSIPLLPEITTYHISDTGRGVPLTAPCVLLTYEYGKGGFIIDMLQWEYDLVKSARIVSALLTNLGIPITSGVTIQAETMDIEEVHLGSKEGHYYAFYTQGYIGTTINFLNSGEYTIRIYGWADIVNGEGALVAVLIDRKSLGIVEVRSTGVYEVDIYVEKGIHEVGIAFTNDYWDPPEDRNLYVDKIEISYSQNRSFFMC